MSEETGKVYKKAVRGKVAVNFINPYGKEETKILYGDPARPDIYDEERMIVELSQDERALKHFMKKNKTLIEGGYLVELSDYELHVDDTNIISDEAIDTLLNKPLTNIKKTVNKFTSSVTVQRIIERAIKNNKSIKLVTYLKERRDSLSGKPIDIPKILKID